MAFIKLPRFMKLSKNADEAATLDELKAVQKKETTLRTVWGFFAFLFIAAYFTFLLFTDGGMKGSQWLMLLGAINVITGLCVIWKWRCHADVEEDATERIKKMSKV